jgi:ubiquinone/menaquinone biosynthesis C-methylase UbiE
MFEVAEAYERQRGRSSKLLAPLFVDFVGVQGEVLDVGCGTGALTFAIARSESVSKIVAMDVSEAFLAYARSKTDDPRISFESGDAHNLHFSDASFDHVWLCSW